MFFSGERELNEGGLYALGWSKSEKGCKSMTFLKGSK